MVMLVEAGLWLHGKLIPVLLALSNDAIGGATHCQTLLVVEVLLCIANTGSVEKTNF